MIRAAALFAAAGRRPRTVDPWHCLNRDGDALDPDDVIDAMVERELGADQ